MPPYWLTSHPAFSACARARVWRARRLPSPVLNLDQIPAHPNHARKHLPCCNPLPSSFFSPFFSPSCPPPLVPPPPPASFSCVQFADWEVGSRYQCINIVGRGSYGSVCKARDTWKQGEEVRNEETNRDEQRRPPPFYYKIVVVVVVVVVVVCCVAIVRTEVL